MAPSTPSRIGKYDVVEVLGRGGMGVVYKAKDPHLGRLVAIKMTAGVGDNPELVSRFFREAQSTASLQHPNIVTVYELGDWNGNPYLVMEYLEGRSLDVIIGSKRPLSLLDELDIVLDACRGLSYAHQRNIIHRDIKPANIVVTKTGAVKLVDFGIAHIVGRKLTLPGQVIGSFNYMSPEQINSKPIDARTDIFSVGIVLYQLLTKTLPFEAETTAATLRKIVNDPPPPLGKFLNVYPPDLEPVILRALAKNRDERYATVEDFAADLRRVREQVKQEMVVQHLKEASALIEANELAKAKDEVFLALKLDPHYAPAGQLMRQIQRRLQGLPVTPELVMSSSSSAKEPQSPEGAKASASPQARPSRLDECIDEARRELSFRRFSSALELLKEAESIDPKAQRVQELLQSVNASREQQKRNQELLAISREIQVAMRWEDLAGACEKAAEGLKKYPNDAGLLKLRDSAEKQRGAAERNRLIDQEVANVQKMLQEDRTEEVIALLVQAGKKFGPDSRLDGLLRFVRENTDRRKLSTLKQDCLRSARDQLSRKDYKAAIRTLETAPAEVKENVSVENLLQFVRDEAAAEQRRNKAAAAADRARELMTGKAYPDAVKFLESTLSEAPDEDLELLLAQTRRDASAHRRKLRSLIESGEKLLQEDRPLEALETLEAESSSFSNNPDFKALLERARAETEIWQDIQQNIAEARSLVASRQYEAARTLLAECKSRYPQSRQLEEELVKVEQQRVADNCKTVEKALTEAAKLHAAGEYESCLEKLAGIAKPLSDVPAVLRSKVEDQQKQASEAIVRRVRMEIEKYLASGQITYAQDALSRTSTNLTVHKALADLEVVVTDEVKRRAIVMRALEEARTRLNRSEWQQATEPLKKALVLQVRVPKLREDLIAEFFRAAECALLADWRSCEQVLKQFREVEPQQPIPESLLSRLADQRRDEAVSACLDRSRLLQHKGDLKGARREVSQVASLYPKDARLVEFAQTLDRLIAQEEEKTRQEQASREQESVVLEALQRSDAQTSLDLRMSILEGAQQKYPDDARIEYRLGQVREFSRRISEMAEAAKAREDAGEYESAVAKWEALRQAYRHYPGIDEHIARLSQLHADTRSLTRGGWIRKLNDAIASSNFDTASMLLTEAIADFPWDQELMAVQGKLQASLRLRSRAQTNIEAARDAFARRRWDAGRRAIVKACQAAPEDRAVWDAAMKEVLGACENSREDDPGFADESARQLSELKSAFPIPTSLAERVRNVVAPPADTKTWSRATGPSATEAFMPGKIFPQTSKSASEWNARREESNLSAGNAAPSERSRENDSSAANYAGSPSMLDARSAARWPEETLREIEKRLAAVVGPVARVLVRRASAQAATIDELVSLLASSLPSETDRTNFLSGNSQFLAKAATRQPAPNSGEYTPTRTPAPNPEIDGQSMERAARILAHYLGPISSVLVKRTAARAHSVRELYLLLAEKVDEGDRPHFLRDAGIST